MNNKVSVIIPIFNASKHIELCLKHLLEQTHRNIEIIIVNDASTDDSLKICEKLSKIDYRIKIVNKQKNERALKARATGLEHANGDFILFVDADDFIPKYAIEKMFASAVNNKSEIVLGSIVVFYDKYLLFKKRPYNIVGGKIIEDSFNKVQINKKFKFAFFGIHSIPVSSWAKLIKKDVLNEFKKSNIPPIHAFDDTYLNLFIFKDVNKITFIKDVVYYYRYGGMTSTFYDKVLHDLSFAHQLRLDLLKKNMNKKALYTSIIELKNTVYQFFINGILTKNITSNNFNDYVDEFKSYNYYEEMKEYLKNKEYANKSFFDKLFKKENKMAFKIIINDYKKIRWKRKTTRFIGNILKNI